MLKVVKRHTFYWVRCLIVGLDRCYMSLLWESSEVPENCFYKHLTNVIGDHGTRGISSLPIDNFKAEIDEAIWENYVVAVQAPTSSGKTMRIPRFMFDIMNPRPASTIWPILVVQQ